MRLFKLVILLFLLFHTVLIHAASFTADAVQIRGENVSKAKMYWLDGDVRFEYMEDGVSMVQIFDNKNNKIIWLDEKNKYFLEKDMPESEKIIAVTKTNKTTDPCKQFIGAECIFLKKAKMNDRDAEKWLITIDNNGNDFHVFQWIDTQYKNILRQENSDGTGISVSIQDDVLINERKVRVLTMTAFAASGNQQQGTQWYDSELDIVVKQKYQDNIIDELQNITIGDVDKSLFLIPDDYTLFDTSAVSAQQYQEYLK